jgi:predicted alpha/beta-fold hydrolase
MGLPASCNNGLGNIQRGALCTAGVQLRNDLQNAHGLKRRAISVKRLAALVFLISHRFRRKPVSNLSSRQACFDAELTNPAILWHRRAGISAPACIARRETFSQSRGMSPQPLSAPQYLCAPDGHRLAYRALAGAAPTIVWLGGLHSDMDGTKAEALHQWAQSRSHGYLRFDYRGHGLSDGRFADCTIDMWAEDARLYWSGRRWAHGWPCWRCPP